MKMRALKIAAASILIFSMLMSIAGAATITKTKFNSGTGEITVDYYVTGDEAVISAYDAADESNILYFDQQQSSGLGTFKFTLPEDYEGETVAVKVGGTNEASSTVYISVTPSPSPTPDPESVEAGGIYKYITTETLADDTVTVDGEAQKVYTDSGFDITPNSNIWNGYAKNQDCFDVLTGNIHLTGRENYHSDDLLIKFAPISEGKTKISFDAKLSINGSTWSSHAYYGAVVNSATGDIAVGVDRANSLNGYSVFDTSVRGTFVRYDADENASGKLTNYEILSTDSAVHTVQYIIDMDNKTYEMSIDGAKIGEYSLYDPDIEYIDAIRFSGNTYGDAYHNGFEYYLDNITLKTTQDIKTNKIKFYNEDGSKVVKELSVREGKQILVPAAPLKRGYTFLNWTTAPNGGGEVVDDFTAISGDISVYANYIAKVNLTFIVDGEVYETRSVDYNSDVVAPTPSGDGEYEFFGWYTEDGSAAVFDSVCEDMIVYAKFAKFLSNDVEDFENGFVIDAANKKITTDSGLAFSADDGAYKIISKSDDGSLYINARQSAAANTNTNLYIDFHEVKSGKVYLSFDLRTNNLAYDNWIAVGGGRFFSIGNASEGGTAANLYLRGYRTSVNNTDMQYVATVKGNRGTTDNVVGTLVKNADFVKVEYFIDMDNKTYSIVYDGVITENIPFTDAALSGISRITMVNDSSGSAAYTNSNYFMDNLTVKTYVLKEEVKVNTYTVTFYDEDGVTVLGTAQVEEGKTAVYTGEIPTKEATAQYTYTFNGWDKSLENITENTSVKAVYSATVNCYTVIFKNYDGTVLDTQSVAYGSAANAPEDPVREEDEEYTYTFSAWDKEFNNITGPLEVTAQYTAVPKGSEGVITLIWGDINGDGKIDAQDLSPMNGYLKGILTTNASGYTVGAVIPKTTIIWGDMNGDGKIDAQDLSPINGYLKGILTTNANGYTVGAVVEIPVSN